MTQVHKSSLADPELEPNIPLLPSVWGAVLESGDPRTRRGFVNLV